MRCHTDAAKGFFPPFLTLPKRLEHSDVYKMRLETLPCQRAPCRFAALGRPLLWQLCLAGEPKRTLAGVQQHKSDKDLNVRMSVDVICRVVRYLDKRFVETCSSYLRVGEIFGMREAEQVC
jgi:hypothetical protein